jgi:hypothetical protein
MVVYDYKISNTCPEIILSLKINQKAGKVPKDCKFNIINFVDVRVFQTCQSYPNRIYSETLQVPAKLLRPCGITAERKERRRCGSDQFFQTSAVNFLAACIYFFVNYKKVPYDKDAIPSLQR